MPFLFILKVFNIMLHKTPLTVPHEHSVMSMLAEPNTESPANVDAAKMWREDRLGFKKKACSSVRKSLDMP